MYFWPPDPHFAPFTPKLALQLRGSKGYYEIVLTTTDSLPHRVFETVSLSLKLSSLTTYWRPFGCLSRWLEWLPVRHCFTILQKYIFMKVDVIDFCFSLIVEVVNPSPIEVWNNTKGEQHLYTRVYCIL